MTPTTLVAPLDAARTAVAAPLAMRAVPTIPRQAPCLPVWAKSKAHIFYYAQTPLHAELAGGVRVLVLARATNIILLLS
jgi:hypothetical protein